MVMEYEKTKMILNLILDVVKYAEVQSEQVPSRLLEVGSTTDYGNHKMPNTTTKITKTHIYMRVNHLDNFSAQSSRLDQSANAF